MEQRVVSFKGIILLVTSSLVVIGGAVVVPALPQIRDQFIAVPHSDLLARMVLALPNLMIALFAPFAGLIIDRLGRKKLLIAALMLYAFSGSIPFLLNSIYAILACRLVFGVALASLMTCSTTLIADYFVGERRNGLMGVQAGCMALGAMAALLLSGMCADISWRAPFLLYFAAVFAVLPVVKYIHEPDWQRIHIKKRKQSAVEIKNLKKIIMVYSVAYSAMVLFFMLPAFLPFYIKQFVPQENIYVAWVIACMSCVRGCVAMLYGVCRRWMRFNGIFIVIFLGMSAGYCIIGSAESYMQIMTGGIICGLGLGFLIPNLTAWIMEFAPQEHRGRIVGGLTACIYFGQFSSPFILSPLVYAFGMARTFLILGGVLTLFAILFAALSIRSFQPNKIAF